MDRPKNESNTQKPGVVDQERKPLPTFEELGWTPEQAEQAREQLADWDDIWNDPDMDLYDEDD